MNEDVVRFRNLSYPLKAAIIASYIVGIIYFVFFVAGAIAYIIQL